MAPFWSLKTLFLILILMTCSINVAYSDIFQGRSFRHQEIKPNKICQDVKCSKVKITFEAYNSHFEIDLVRNDALFSDDYVEIYDDVVVNEEVNGRSIAMSDHCYYLSHPLSSIRASLSLCEEKIQGFVSRSNVNYIIRFDHEESSQCIYRESDLPKVNLRCGNTEFMNEIREFQKSEYEHLEPNVVSDPRVETTLVKYVEWVLVIDSTSFVKRFKSDRNYLRSEIMKMLNHINGIYLKLDFHILLKSLIVWEKKDQIKQDASLDAYVRNFIRYNEDYLFSKFKQDTASLLTAKDFKEEDILGFSTKGFTCNAPEIAAGISVYKDDMSTEFISIIISHEMGHTLGFDDEYYDHTGNCRQGCAIDFCIMSGKVTKPTHEWSACTRNVVKRRILDQRYHCLYNVPISNSSAISICSNGVIEDGEECDCPSTDSLCLNCCRDCKLTPGSKCSSGPCCRNCQILPSDTPCRPARDLYCDISDVCDGVSEHCQDVYKPNYQASCETNNRWCIDGRCEYKCLFNCSNHGSCVKKETLDSSSSPTDQFECECFNSYYGRFCQHPIILQRMLLFHLISGFVMFIIAFLVTCLLLSLNDHLRKRKRNSNSLTTNTTS